MRRKWMAVAALFAAVGWLTTGAAAAAEPLWGVGLRLGSFGVPDLILDRIFAEHPTVSGDLVGAELRYYGNGGPRGALSLALTVDQGTASADGIWRRHPDDDGVTGRGEVSLLAATLTVYWDLFAASPVHPFLGLGIGYARMWGSYEEDGIAVHVREDLPAVHLPVGLAVQLGRYLTLRGEARVLNGFSLGGNLMLNF